MLTITVKELSKLIEKNPESIDLIDVRGTWEYSEVHIPQAKNIPLHILPMRLSELDKSKKVIFICRSGGRSTQATMFAENEGIKWYNVTGGMSEFERLYPAQVIHGEKKKLFGLF